MRLSWAALLAVFVTVAGCAREPVYRIGAQDETSSVLMAELVSETLRRAGARTVRVPCGTLRGCIQALRGGQLELLPAYSGDAVALVRVRGQARTDVSDLEQARRAYSLLDLLVSRRLGFEAPYAVVARADRATQSGITGIKDLATLPQGVRMAVPEGYASRPGDGLYALSRRYGLALAPDGVTVVADPAERMAAVLEGPADAALVRDFDYDLASLGLVRLEDELGFFPRYEATVLLGPSASARIAQVQGALSSLVGRVTTADMRRLMQEVLVHGWMPEQVARRLLVEKGIAEALRRGVERPPVVLAVDPRDELGAQQEYASRVVSQAFPARPFEFLQTHDPLGALATGVAAIAVVDAARFFVAGQNDPLGARDERGEAAAVLGDRRLYLLRSAKGPRRRHPLSGRVGVQAAGSSGGRVAANILEGLGREPEVRASADALIDPLAQGRLDAALVLASRTPAAVIEASREKTVRLESLAPHVAEVPFFLVDTRIPPGTFPGQARPVDTFSMQLLLAGPAPPQGYALRAGGPASAIATAGQPLTVEEAEVLARASATAERPDPVVQSVWERAARQERAARGVTTDAVDTTLNVLVFVFLFWFVLLLVRRERFKPADHGTDRPPPAA